MDSSLHSQMSTSIDNTAIAQAQTSSTNHPNPTIRMQAILQKNVPDFIKPSNWPYISPDLNPVDYSIWDGVQQLVYRSLEVQKRRPVAGT